MSFKVGDRVVCVKGAQTHCKKKRVVKDREYLVSGTDIFFGIATISLEETGKAQWREDRFRKIDADFASDVIENIMANPNLEVGEMYEYLEHEIAQDKREKVDKM